MTFHGIFLLAVTCTLDTDIVILGFQNVPSGGASSLAPVGFILAAWGHVGEPQEQQEGHVRVQR